ncbi:MAG: DoxX family protein [Gammaproteobacteria bacterium]
MTLSSNHPPAAAANFLGRLMLGGIFVMAGWSKIGGYEGTQAFMDGAGVPGELLPLVILLEIGAGAALILGVLPRLSALALAAFTVAAAFLFHADFADHMQSLLFTKNIGLAGGLLYIAAVGETRCNLTQWFLKRGSGNASDGKAHPA